MSTPNKYSPQTNTPILNEARGIKNDFVAEPEIVKRDVQAQTNAQPVIVLDV